MLINEYDDDDDDDDMGPCAAYDVVFDPIERQSLNCTIGAAIKPLYSNPPNIDIIVKSDRPREPADPRS